MQYKNLISSIMIFSSIIGFRFIWYLHIKYKLNSCIRCCCSIHLYIFYLSLLFNLTLLDRDHYPLIFFLFIYIQSPEWSFFSLSLFLFFFVIAVVLFNILFKFIWFLHCVIVAHVTFGTNSIKNPYGVVYLPIYMCEVWAYGRKYVKVQVYVFCYGL